MYLTRGQIVCHVRSSVNGTKGLSLCPILRLLREVVFGEGVPELAGEFVAQ